MVRDDARGCEGHEEMNNLEIALVDVDSHDFPNLALMKISAYHKARGDNVEFINYLKHYDIAYVSKIFGDEYSQPAGYCINADMIIEGGTWFCIDVVNGREVFRKSKHKNLPYEIEHTYPDYSLYPGLTKDTAFGFLTRGCPNNCGYCIVSKKEGLESLKVADLSEFWNGQKYIKLMDANLLACKDRSELLKQLVDSNAWVDFTQGLDARFVNEDTAELLKCIKTKLVHFAFDRMAFRKQIIDGLKTYKEVCKLSDGKSIVYMLTNYDTTIEEDLYRVRVIGELGYMPDVRIYRKSTAPKILRDLQRWCNNRILYKSCDFMDYVPRKDGKTIKEIYFKG